MGEAALELAVAAAQDATGEAARDGARVLAVGEGAAVAAMLLPAAVGRCSRRCGAHAIGST